MLEEIGFVVFDPIPCAARKVCIAGRNCVYPNALGGKLIGKPGRMRAAFVAP